MLLEYIHFLPWFASFISSFYFLWILWFGLRITFTVFFQPWKCTWARKLRVPGSTGLTARYPGDREERIGYNRYQDPQKLYLLHCWTCFVHFTLYTVQYCLNSHYSSYSVQMSKLYLSSYLFFRSSLKYPCIPLYSPNISLYSPCIPLYSPYISLYSPCIPLYSPNISLFSPCIPLYNLV